MIQTVATVGSLIVLLEVKNLILLARKPCGSLVEGREEPQTNPR